MNWVFGSIVFDSPYPKMGRHIRCHWTSNSMTVPRRRRAALDYLLASTGMHLSHSMAHSTEPHRRVTVSLGKHCCDHILFLF